MHKANIMNQIQCLFDDIFHGHILPASIADQTKIILLYFSNIRPSDPEVIWTIQ